MAEEQGRLEEGERVIGGGEEGKKRGRPTNVERFRMGERRGSEGNIEDLWKRKRDLTKEGEEEGWLEGFRKNKKTMRSPVGKEEGVGRQLEEMREMIGKGFETMAGQIRVEMEGIKDEMRKREQEYKRERKEMEGKLEELGRRMEVMEKREVEERRKREVGGGGGEEALMERRIRRLEGMLEEKEREERRGNVVVRGLGGEKDKEKEEVEALFEKMGVEVKVEGVRKVGGKEGGRGGYWW